MIIMYKNTFSVFLRHSIAGVIGWWGGGRGVGKSP